LKGNILIRANFGINPKNISDNEWAELYQGSQWLERYRASLQAKMMGL
jgi:hypothetical protein